MINQYSTYQTFTNKYLFETYKILNQINEEDVENLINELKLLKNNSGRLILLGVGGSSATVSHATNDFRKICEIESYCATDNISELTALTNDIGWENTFTQWLKESKLSSNDAILICSVGGGDIEHNVSMNIVNAIDYANTIGAKVLGIVGRNGGYTKTHSNACILIPSIDPERVTPHVEGISGVILHLIVSHPKLKVNQTKWESAK